MARGKGQAVERLKVVNKRLRESVSEDGKLLVDGVQIPLYLDSTGDVLFVFLLPEYVSKALNKPDRVTGQTAEIAEQAYKKVLREYVQWKRTAVAELVILADIRYVGATEKGDRSIMSKRYQPTHTRGGDFVLSREHKIGLEWDLAFRVNGELFQREPVTADVTEAGHHLSRGVPVDPPQWIPGTRLGYGTIGQNSKVFPYSVELEEKLKLVTEAIDQAARVLHSVDTAEDPTQALLGLGSGGLLRLK